RCAIAPYTCSRRTRERTVDHGDRVLEAIHRRERAEARALLLTEQYLIKHVEPLERYARLAVFGFYLAGAVEERLAPADFIHDLLNFLCRGIGWQLREAVAQIEQRRPLAFGRLAEFLRRQHEIAEVMNGVADERVELGMRLWRHARPIVA